MTVIGLDVDGVILDYISGFMDYAKSLGVRIGCGADEVSSYSMSNAFPDLAETKIYDMLLDFSVTEGFGRLNFYDGVGHSITNLLNRFDDLEFVAITNAGTSEITQELRKLNLKSLPLKEITVLPLRVSKAEVLKQLPAQSIYVDDLMSHITTAEDLGHTGILFRQSYNIVDDHCRVVHNWQEIEASIVNILEG
jgi:5'(3')-deoxyribonucleotidase